MEQTPHTSVGSGSQLTNTIEQQLALFMNNTSEPVMIVGPDLKIITFNRQFHKQYRDGFGKAIEKGRSILEYARIISPRKLKDIHREVIAGGSKEVEVNLQLPSRDFRTLFIRYRPAFNNEGQIFGTCFSFDDVTDRVKAERLLAASEVRHHDLLESISDAFVALDKDLRYTYLNKRAAELLQRDGASLIGRHLLDVFPDALGSDTYQAVNKVMAERVPVINIDYYAPLDLWQENRFYPSDTGVSLFIRDITSQTKAEQAFLQSHKLLKKLTDKVPVAVYQFEIDPTGKMTFPFMSPAILQMQPGVDIQALKEDAGIIFKSMHPDDVSPLIRSIEMSRQELSDWDLEFRILSKERGQVWLKGSSRPERRKDGSVVWYGYMQDITGRKMADEDIRIAKERYDIVAKATNEAVWDLDLRTSELHWGDGFKSLFGYDTGHDVSIETWITHIHDDDREPVQQKVREVIAGREKNWQQEYRFVRSDGSCADVLDRGFVIRDEQGKAIRMIGAMQDITERKMASERIRIIKERYDLVAKATNDAIFDWDFETNEVIRTGDGLQVLFGYSPEEVSRYSDFWKERVHPDDLEPSYGKLEACLKDVTKNLCSQEYRFRRADGSYAVVFDKGYIIRDQSGKPIRLIGATQDISDRKEAEAQLKTLNDILEKRAEELARSNADLEQFAYVASHDLQEPLRMVSSFLAQLETNYKKKLDDKARQYIHFATDGASRMKGIILDLLEYSRVGREDFTPEPIDAGELLQSAIQLNRVLIEEKGAVVNFKDLPGLKGNKVLLQQLFHNLLGNGLKYHASETKPVVTVTALEQPAHWQLAFADNGIGIEEQFFEKIFVIFQRLHGRSEYSGTGIGLAMCKKIVESHYGKIWVESEPGKGSTFYFTLAK